MNILLIAPATGHWRRIGRRRTFNGKTFRFSMLSLLSVAGLSPRDANITLVDEQVEDVPETAADGTRFDLVGITAMTALAPRAYALCARFRAEGVPVVMGGYHATLNTEEALEHADAVVVGPAYGAWERVCEDVQSGCLERVYRGDPRGPVPRRLPRHLLADERYATVNATFATFGCRNRCAFCSIGPFHGGKRHIRPVADVVDEVAAFSSDFFIFVDDNLTQERAYAMALFEGLATLGKKWVTQASLEIAEDPELLAAMRDAGCAGVFVGIESFSDRVLKEQVKSCNVPDHYREAVAAFHRHGMFVEAGVIVGFDADGVEVFQDTLRGLERIGVDAIQLAILTPLPGTGLYESLKRRIFDHDWEHYDFRHAVFEPKRMRRQELQAGADWMIRRFYSPWRIFKRLTRWLVTPACWKHLPYALTLNLAYLGRVKRFGIRGWNPAVQRAPRLQPYRKRTGLAEGSTTERTAA